MQVAMKTRKQAVRFCLREKKWMLIFLIPMLLYQSQGGQQIGKQAKAIDTVPRQRLVSNQELLSLLDPNDSRFQNIRNELQQHDTIQALRLLAEYFKIRTQPKYFFQHTEFPARVKEYVSLYPEEVRYLKATTRNFLKTYGVDVDWRRPGKDLLGREHTPNTVRYLARQWHAEHIALTYFIEQDRTYLDFLMSHVRDFVNDYEAGKAESGANDVFERFYGGHRARNWLSVHNMLLASKEYTPEDHMYFVKVFLLHGARLIDVCKKFHWGNHQLVGLVALYELTTMYPEFPVMREWNRISTSVLLEHIEKEVPPDGFQVERASHYFKLDIMNYFRVRQLSTANNIALPQVFQERFRKMFDAIVAVAMPNRSMPVLQDAQARYRPQSNDMAELPEPEEKQYMSLGAALFNDPVYKYFGDDTMPPSLYWLFDAETVVRYSSIPVRQPTVSSVGLPDTKYYVMRTGWSDDDKYMVIDGGLAENKPDHTHGGILGLQLYAQGELFLPNYHVRYSEPSYQFLKNSLVKNVALVDTFVQGRGWRDNKARTGFGIWTKLPKPTVRHWIGGEKYDYFEGTHDGFDTLGVAYTRKILFLKPDYWVVVDDFQANGSHSYQQIWQGEFEIDRANRRIVKKGKEGKFAISFSADQDLMIAPQRVGDISSVWFVTTTKGGTVMMSILAPMKNDEQIPVVELSDDREEGEFLVRRSDKSYDRVILRGKSLVVSRYESEQLQSFLVVNAQMLQSKEFTLSLASPAMLEGTRERSGRFTIRSLGEKPQPVTLTRAGGTRTFSIKSGQRVEIVPPDNAKN